MPTTPPPVPRALGALAAVMKDHLYIVGSTGRIFTTPWVITEPGARYYAAIVLTARGLPFALQCGNEISNYQAVAIKQMTPCALTAANVRLISFQIEPTHPHFTTFRAIPAPGILALDRAHFTRFNARLEAAYCGQLSGTEAAQLFTDIVDATLPYLPPARPPDPRVQRAIELLWANHDYPLDDLAAAVGVSYDRLSHLFPESIGLTLRAYQLWHKVRKAAALLVTSQHRLTDVAHAAGFTDSSHMCRTFSHVHLAPPSYFMNPNHVKIVAVTRRAPSAPATSNVVLPE